MTDSLDEQKEETYWAFDELQSKQDLPEMAVVEFQFVPFALTANWDGFAKKIDTLGFETRIFFRSLTFEILTRPIVLTVERIWFYEKQFTKIALSYGFKPDGWGFFGVDSNGPTADKTS